jgi:hypothetical protein
MATLLDAPRSPNPAKLEQFVERQLTAARRRVRVLDIFVTGLVFAVGSLAFLLAALLLNRYVEFPRGTWWGVTGLYIAAAAWLIYYSLFRPSRRDINPYFAARQVEQTMPEAKNSLVTWVDFEEDNQLPGSIRNAIAQKAARDLKGVDLNRAIENRRILWLAIAGGVFLLASLVVMFLPATRTELRIEEPKNGDTTVFNNQEVAFQVHVAGRIPPANAPDAVRLRMWYNPDDPENFEDRPMRAGEDDRRSFSLIVPAKHVRNGFRYKILAGNTQTPTYTVTCKIVPEFTGFDVSYVYPSYLKRPPESTNDPNLLAPYGSMATLIVSTNREVKNGHIEIVGQPRSIEGQLVEGRPEAIQFSVPFDKESRYTVSFTTPEGDKNQNPPQFRLGVIDPKPLVRAADISYQYPAYLRFKPMTVLDVREPEIEANRGTKVVLTAKTTRGVESAKLELPGGVVVDGEKVEDQPMWVRFKLPPLDQDGMAKITFKPATNEATSTPREIPVRVLTDQAPDVKLTKPEPDEVTLPANGTLPLEGLATDDHGVDKLSLRMRVNGSEIRDLKPKLYRGGMSFLRKEDNSWPTKVEYKDFIKLQDLRLEKDPNWRVAPGTEIEYWLEALDNCNIPPGPNLGESTPHKRIKVVAPATKPDDQKKIEQQNQKVEQEQKNHEKKQDQANANEKRDVQQQPPKGAEKQPENQGGQPERKDPTDPNNMGERTGMNPPGMNEQNPMNPPTPMGSDPEQEARNQAVQDAIRKAEQDRKPGDVKPDPRPQPEAKVDPSGAKPQPKDDPMGGPPPAEQRDPKTDPNKPMMGESAAGESRGGNVDKTKEEKGDAKPASEPKPGMNSEPGGDKPMTQPFGGVGEKPAEDKPEPKDPPAPKPGMPPEKPVDRGRAAKPPEKPDPKDPKAGDQPQTGATKPDKDVTASEDKKPSSEAGGPMGGNMPPSDVAQDKPKQSPEAGGSKPEKKDQTADAGGSRSQPKEQDAASGSKPSKPTDPKTEEARGGSKAGPQDPGEKNQDPGELNREPGELAREINSPNPEVSDKAKDDVDRLMRNPQTREQTRKELDRLERNAKDELSRKKAQDLRNRGEQAAKNYDQEKPTPESVDKLAKKLGSKDEQERKDAEQRIKDWEKDQQAKKDLQDQADELKKKDRNAGEQVQKAMDKAEQARMNEPNGGNAGKPDEKQLGKIAKDLNGSDEKKRADAQQKLNEMIKDPKNAQATQDKLKEMADKANGQDKKDIENAMKEADKMAKAGGPMDPKNDKLDPKALEDAAKKLASGDPKAQQEAKDQLKERMKDPKAAQEAQDKLKEMAKNAKTPEEKQALENAAKQAGELAKNMGEKPEQNLDPKDLKELAKQLAGNDPKAKEDAQKKLQEMMNDPKAAEQAKKMLDDMAKNDKNSAEDQKALEDAMKQMNDMAKNEQDAKDLKDLAKQFDKMDPKAKEELKKKMEEAMKDPKKREEMKKAAEQLAKQPKSPQEQQQFDEMMRQVGGNFPEFPGKPDPADPRHKLKSAELLLEDFKKKRKDIQPELRWTDDQAEKWMKDQEAAIAALRKQVEKGEWISNRSTAVPGTGGIVKPTVNVDDKNNPLNGGKYGPPSGYIDPYKKFTGGGAAEPKR